MLSSCMCKPFYAECLNAKWPDVEAIMLNVVAPPILLSLLKRTSLFSQGVNDESRNVS
jgi:hypothetical protein